MNEYEKIEKSEFEFVQSDSVIHDEKLATKPVGYFKDAFRRFKKNRSSVAAAIIIICLFAFAIFGPLFTNYTTTDVDGFYKLSLPKSTLFSWAGWDGARDLSYSQAGYDQASAIFYEELSDDAKNVDAKAIKKVYRKYDVTTYDATTKQNVVSTFYDIRLESYNNVGYVYMDLSAADYFSLQAYQDQRSIQVIYPLPYWYYSNTNANQWYKLTEKETKRAIWYQGKTRNDAQPFSSEAQRDADGNLVPFYLGTQNENECSYYSKMRLKGDGQYSYDTYKAGGSTLSQMSVTKTGHYDNGYYQYGVKTTTGYRVRVLYKEYYYYKKCTEKFTGDKDALLSVYNASLNYVAKDYLKDNENLYVVEFLPDNYSSLSEAEKATAYESALEQANTKYIADDDSTVYDDYLAYKAEKIEDAAKAVKEGYSFKNNGFYAKYLFGSNDKGKCIFTMLASGARLSFVLAIVVSMINLTIGAIYGAIEGYYGGKIDLILERVAEILSGVPFIVVATLFKLHIAESVGALGSLIFAFVLTGWLGMAARTRMQFYRFKNQEYVLSARTLGAKDPRIMFKHIFPNAIGTLITGSVLSIPGVIFAESSLSYLNIINLETSGFTSVGTLLANGSNYLSTYPHIVLFPAIFIALLEISFNLLGNGLRDAFNPSLRGVE